MSLQLIVIFIVLAVFAAIMVFIIWGGGGRVEEQFGAITACNNQLAKCACLLQPDGDNPRGVPFDCPSGFAMEYSSSCPKYCSDNNFNDRLAAAKSAFQDDPTSNKRAHFGHCCQQYEDI